VHIRPLLLDDEAEFLRLVHASRVLHRPWSYPPLTVEDRHEGHRSA
jgi:hypothetical protein